MAAFDILVIEVVRNDTRGLRFHDLRHSYATWLVHTGVPINDAQRLLGHSPLSTRLDLYTQARQHLDPRFGSLLPLDDAAESDAPDGGERKAV
ncbi:MAG TPA: tyrosine-type recombinase/integrase [Nocardioidaceae bacterium]|nr:tyrosine-type recombinase/integrase [Nocardioidaceae bacterium]